MRNNLSTDEIPIWQRPNDTGEANTLKTWLRTPRNKAGSLY